jgi:predicted acyl esterase
VNPYHPYTAESQKPIAAGEIARLDVEIFGTSWRFAPGHKLRLTLRTSAAPWAIPTALQTKGLLGGVYQVQRNSVHASFVNLPLLDARRLASGCSVCIPPAA